MTTKKNPHAVALGRRQSRWKGTTKADRAKALKPAHTARKRINTLLGEIRLLAFPKSLIQSLEEHRDKLKYQGEGSVPPADGRESGMWNG